MTKHSVLDIYRETVTGVVYVLAGRDKHRVHLRDLDSEPGDPAGVVVMGEWEFWVAKTQGHLNRIPL